MKTGILLAVLWTFGTLWCWLGAWASLTEGWGDDPIRFAAGLAYAALGLVHVALAAVIARDGIELRESRRR